MNSIIKLVACTILVLSLGRVQVVGASDGQSNIKGDQLIPDMLISSYSGGASLVKNGAVVWNFGRGKGVCQDAWMLADGNYLIPTGDTVQIVTPDNKIIWKHQEETPANLTTPPTDPKKLNKWKPRTAEIHSCQPLPNGDMMVVEGAHARVLEVNKAGEIVK